MVPQHLAVLTWLCLLFTVLCLRLCRHIHIQLTIRSYIVIATGTRYHTTTGRCHHTTTLGCFDLVVFAVDCVVSVSEHFSVFRPVVTFHLTFFYLSLSTYPSLMFQLTEQAAHFAVISEKLEKEVREKAELSAQLMELKGQLRACDREVTIVS